jgi:putrescine aminotransferase
MTTRRTEIVAATGAFHGFTLGALALCGIPVHSRAYGPLLPDVKHVPFGDGAALAAAVSQRTAAVVLEPIQAEVGAETPPPGYLAEAQAICEQAGALLVIDEVRTGMGRTGPLFAIEDQGVMPDVLLVGKSLAGGIVPIGALLARRRLWPRVELSFSMSASSFSGNRLACVAALATLDLAEQHDVVRQGRDASVTLRASVEALQSRYPALLHRVSGQGLLLGLHFASAAIAGEVIRASIQGGLLIAAAFCNNRCVLLEPPLIISRDQIAHAMEILDGACADAARAGTVSPSGVTT